MNNDKTYQQLTDELKACQYELSVAKNQLEELQIQLEESNDTINAIRLGEVDALIVRANDGHQLYTLKSADQTYRIFIEQMVEGAVTFNTQGNILYCNSQFAQILKQPLQRIIGQPFLTFVSVEHADFAKQLIRSAWQTNVKGEIKIVGSPESYFLLSLKILELDEGLSMSATLTDLTELKDSQKLLSLKNQELELAHQITNDLNNNLEQTVLDRTLELEKSIVEKSKIEADLRHNQERLVKILETIAEGVGIINKEGKIIYANPIAQKLLNIESVDPENSRNFFFEKVSYFVDGRPLPYNEHPLYLAITNGQAIFDFEIAFESKRNERIFISINAAPLQDEDNEISSAVATFTDVTHRRRVIQQKDEFISVASHELKTPITTLKSSLQLLNRIKNNPQPNLLPKLIDQANKSLNRVSTLIDDLLNATRMSEGQLQLNKKTFHVASIIDDCCQHITSEGNYHVTLEGDTDLVIKADQEKIEQVIVNLVNNAIKYAPNSLEIKISIERHTDFARISVTDRGDGIPPDKLNQLFERYYRVDNSSQVSGLGLGLYICSEIVRKHDGEIGAVSTLGKGTTFWFTLPL